MAGASVAGGTEVSAVAAAAVLASVTAADGREASEAVPAAVLASDSVADVREDVDVADVVLASESHDDVTSEDASEVLVEGVALSGGAANKVLSSCRYSCCPNLVSACLA
jgi:hypothetical protein